jgi:hypothetical protein
LNDHDRSSTRQRQSGQDGDPLLLAWNRKNASRRPSAGTVQEVAEDQLQGAAREVKDELRVDALDAIDDRLASRLVRRVHQVSVDSSDEPVAAGCTRDGPAANE